MWDFFINPFQKAWVVDYEDFKSLPFVILPLHRMLEQKLKFSFDHASQELYVILTGERGCGKTTTVLFCDDIIKKQNDPNLQCLFFHTLSPLTSFSNFINLIKKERAFKSEDSVSQFKEFLGKKKWYFLIDMPDEIEGKVFHSFYRFLSTLLPYKNQVNCIVVMNREHYDMAFRRFSLVLGKFEMQKIQSFTLDEIKEIMILRMKNARKSKSTTIEPFTFEAIDFIFNFTHGNPRNFFIMASNVFTAAAMEEKIITIDFCKKIIGGADAIELILRERCAEPTLREQLLKIAYLIKNEYHGFVDGEEQLLQNLMDKFGITRVTARKRVRQLQKYGIGEIRKDPENLLRNQIRILL